MATTNTRFAGVRGSRRGRFVKTRASFDAAAKRIKKYARGVEGGLGVGLRLVGEEIRTDVEASAPGRGVPRDYGTLASTGRVDGPAGTVTNPQVTVSFGGAAAPYALVQHERTDYHHDLGEARYLVRGMERWRPDGSAAMAGIRANAELARRRAAAGGA